MCRHASLVNIKYWAVLVCEIIFLLQLVIDSILEAINLSRAGKFNEILGVDGTVLYKWDVT